MFWAIIVPLTLKLLLIAAIPEIVVLPSAVWPDTLNEFWIAVWPDIFVLPCKIVWPRTLKVF